MPRSGGGTARSRLRTLDANNRRECEIWDIFLTLQGAPHWEPLARDRDLGLQRALDKEPVSAQMVQAACVNPLCGGFIIGLDCRVAVAEISGT